MKLFSLVSLLALTTTLASCNPIASADADAEPFAQLEERGGCKVNNGGHSFTGTCVDVRKGKQCAGGLLVTGACGGGNTIICCIQGYVIGGPKSKSGMGSKPKAKTGLGSKPKAKTGLGSKPKAKSGMGSKPKAKTGLGSKPKAKTGMGSAPKVGWGNKPIRREFEDAAEENFE